MAIKKFSNYEGAQSYKEYQPLPKDGYVLKILGAEVCESAKGQYVKISCDIAEGEFKDYFAIDYKSNANEDKKWRCNYILSVPDDSSEEWQIRRFKTTIEAIEESNKGFHFDWDEKKFVGKLVGGLFNVREYEKTDGSVGSSVNLAKLTTVEKIRSGKFVLPKDKLIDRVISDSSASAANAFMDITDSELPFIV